MLQRQIREREEERVRGNRRRLVEEKAAVEKVRHRRVTKHLAPNNRFV